MNKTYLNLLAIAALSAPAAAYAQDAPADDSGLVPDVLTIVNLPDVEGLRTEIEAGEKKRKRDIAVLKRQTESLSAISLYNGNALNAAREDINELKLKVEGLEAKLDTEKLSESDRYALEQTIGAYRTSFKKYQELVTAADAPCDAAKVLEAKWLAIPTNKERYDELAGDSELSGQDSLALAEKIEDNDKELISARKEKNQKCSEAITDIDNYKMEVENLVATNLFETQATKDAHVDARVDALIAKGAVDARVDARVTTGIDSALDIDLEVGFGYLSMPGFGYAVPLRIGGRVVYGLGNFKAQLRAYGLVGDATLQNESITNYSGADNQGDIVDTWTGKKTVHTTLSPRLQLDAGAAYAINENIDLGMYVGALETKVTERVANTRDGTFSSARNPAGFSEAYAQADEDVERSSRVLGTTGVTVRVGNDTVYFGLDAGVQVDPNDNNKVGPHLYINAGLGF